MASTADSRAPLNVLLPALGSAGDMHPIVALALALRERGHRATILTNPFFQPLIEQQGIGFLPVGSLEDARVVFADPHLWDVRKGFEVIARRVIVPAIEPVYRLIEKHMDSGTVVAFSSLAFGARVAQEKLAVPCASIHLQPSVMRSLVDPGVVGNLRIPASAPPWFKRAFFRALDWTLVDRNLKGPLNEFRASLGLPAIDRVMHRWIHSPQLVICFFPAWFAAPQPDWPPNTELVGFALWDGGGAALPPAAREFLSAKDAPVIFTPGSAASTMQRFFRESVQAAQRLGLRAMFITNFPGQVPAPLPRGMQTFGYLPFSEVLPRAALLVHHGGIGTFAQAVKAAIPQLVVPNAFDQFDSGRRVQRLGLGRCIPQSRYRARAAALAIRASIAEGAIKQRSLAYGASMDSAAALRRACELIENLAL